MSKAVLDTNVLVSALLKAGSLEDRVLKLVLGKHLTAYVSRPILAEYQRVLDTPKLSLNQELVKYSL